MVRTACAVFSGFMVTVAIWDQWCSLHVLGFERDHKHGWNFLFSFTTLIETAGSNYPYERQVFFFSARLFSLWSNHVNSAHYVKGSNGWKTESKCQSVRVQFMFFNLCNSALSVECFTLVTLHPEKGRIYENLWKHGYQSLLLLLVFSSLTQRRLGKIKIPT